MGHLFDKFKIIFRNFHAYVQRYVWPLPKFHREIVVMIDGVFHHGGLTDRFRNILSIYSYCKEHDLRFRLYYTYPLPLEKLLVPNKYNWSINKSELSFSCYDSEEVHLWVELYKDEKLFSKKNIQLNNSNHQAVLDKIRKLNKRKQYHIYGNCYFAKGHFYELFNELFQLTPYLQNRIEQYSFDFPYEAVTLRFQQLLGDFKEGTFAILSDDEKKKLIDSCSQKIENLYKEGYFATTELLVTSDSPIFLKHIQQLPYVHIIPGKMEHMDYTHNVDLDMNAKSFIDLFLLSKAQRITLLQTGKMYKSGFPEFAAELGDKPYNKICF